MKAITRDVTSKRWGYDGWALRIKGAEKPLSWSLCTTRQEARELRKDQPLDLFERLEVVKVKLTMESYGG